MSVTVSIAFAIFKPSLPIAGTPWWPLIALGVITFLARFTLFFGVKQLGGMQTSLLGLGELLITLMASQLFLHESFSVNQWIGAFLIGVNLVLVAYDKPPVEKRLGKGFLNWLAPPIISPTDFPFRH